jgi:hypothetical protein
MVSWEGMREQVFWYVMECDVNIEETINTFRGGASGNLYFLRFSPSF